MLPLKQQITLQSTAGLHASLAAKIVSLAGRFDAHVQIQYEDKIIDAKSILGLISLAIPTGENLVIIAEGDQAKDAMNELQKLLSKEEHK